MKVTKLKGCQYNIYHEDNFYFQSDEEIIAKYNEYERELQITWDYNCSRTISKCFKEWINFYVEVDVSELKKMIKNNWVMSFFIEDNYGNQVKVIMCDYIND